MRWSGTGSRSPGTPPQPGHAHGIAVSQAQSAAERTIGRSWRRASRAGGDALPQATRLGCRVRGARRGFGARFSRTDLTQRGLWSSGVAVSLVHRHCCRETCVARDEHAVDLPGYVAFEAADDLSFALARLRQRCASLRTPACADPAHPGQAGHVQRAVGFPVATAVEAMPHDLAGGGFDGGATPHRLAKEASLCPGRSLRPRSRVALTSGTDARGELLKTSR